MENEIENKNLNFFEKVSIFFKNNIKILISLLLLILIFILGYVYLDYHQNIKNERASEKFIKAGLSLSLEDKDKAKEIYKEIIFSNNKFYSLMSLNNIIDNNLEKDSNEVLKLFLKLEKLKLEKEEKNLLKLKKALFLIKISRENEGDILLKEIISQNSIWKDTASELLK
tara:strand:+ start:241 stop:750 length:510 start_codon:yes stop_codon:yes gene_type:complete